MRTGFTKIQNLTVKRNSSHFSLAGFVLKLSALYLDMATKTSLVGRFDDIVASTNILVAGTEGSEFCYGPAPYQL